jgi:hypothetical protein
MTDPFNIIKNKYWKRRYDHDMAEYGESMLRPDVKGTFFASVSKHGSAFVLSQNYVFLNQNAPPVLCYDTPMAKTKLWSLALYTIHDTSEMRCLLLDALCLYYLKTKPRYIVFYCVVFLLSIGLVRFIYLKSYLI